MFAHGPRRSAIIGFVGGLPFAAGAYVTAAALFGSHIRQEFQFLDAGPLGPVGAAIGVLIASTVVARELAKDWTSSLKCGIAFAVLGHVLAVAFGALLNVATRGVGPDSVMIFINAGLTTAIGAALPWALAATIWVGLYRGWLRSEAPPVQAGDAEVRGLRQVQGHELGPFTRPSDRPRR